ncbi:MAG: F-type H+-transporting ATPase subunit a, partial [Algoriphagus sp.]
MTRKTLVISLLISAFLLGFTSNTYAAGAEEDKTSFIMHHVKDSHEWHFATFGH